MYQLNARFDCCGYEAASILTKTLGFFGSLAGDYHHWLDIISVLGEGNGLEEKGDALLVAAVPEEGDIHPQRAEILDVGRGSIQFKTPGGVTVSLVQWPNEVELLVGFGRDSTFAARCLIGRLYEASGGAIDLPFLEGEEDPFHEEEKVRAIDW